MYLCLRKVDILSKTFTETTITFDNHVISNGQAPIFELPEDGICKKIIACQHQSFKSCYASSCVHAYIVQLDFFYRYLWLVLLHRAIETAAET